MWNEENQDFLQLYNSLVVFDTIQLGVILNYTQFLVKDRNISFVNKELQYNNAGWNTLNVLYVYLYKERELISYNIMGSDE